MDRSKNVCDRVLEQPRTGLGQSCIVLGLIRAVFERSWTGLGTVCNRLSEQLGIGLGSVWTPGNGEASGVGEKKCEK